MAFMGFGEYHAGDWCRFCRANGICKAQASNSRPAPFDDFSCRRRKLLTAILSPAEMGEGAEARRDPSSRGMRSVRAKALESLAQRREDPRLQGRGGPKLPAAGPTKRKPLTSSKRAASTAPSSTTAFRRPWPSSKSSSAAAKFKELVGEFVTKPAGQARAGPRNRFPQGVQQRRR